MVVGFITAYAISASYHYRCEFGSRSGEVFKRSVTEFDIAYRKVVPQHKGEYFIGANLKFPQTGKQQDIQDLIKIVTQPVKLKAINILIL
jgi:hypothetical protein